MRLPVWLATRPRKQKCTTIVLHASDGKSAASSVAWLRKIGLSYHFIIERDGSYIKLAPLSRVAFHAGNSFGPEGANVNEYSIGICFANFDSRGEVPTEAAVATARKIIEDVCRADPGVRFITRHRDISPRRKSDPATLRNDDYKTLSEGLTMWKP